MGFHFERVTVFIDRKQRITEDRGQTILTIVFGGATTGRLECLGYIFRFWCFPEEC